MKLKLSSKGQVVLPVAIRSKYQLRTGDLMEVVMKDDEFTVVPPKVKKRKGRIVKDPITGLPCVTFGPGAPEITKEMVDKLLEDFP
jgi:AbrB family looped-hinge helix DNA binding protein